VPRPAESHDLLTDPVVAAQVDPSFPSSRLLGPGRGNPSSGTVLVLRGQRDVPGFPQFKKPHRKQLIPHVGSDVGSNAGFSRISKLEHLVTAMCCAPGRNRTYDRQIRRLLLYPLSYGGLGARRHRRTPCSRITVAPDLLPNKSIGTCSPPG
jgi:hypothetical protein